MYFVLILVLKFYVDVLLKPAAKLLQIFELCKFICIFDKKVVILQRKNEIST